MRLGGKRSRRGAIVVLLLSLNSVEAAVGTWNEAAVAYRRKDSSGTVGAVGNEDPQQPARSEATSDFRLLRMLAVPLLLASTSRL